MSIFQIHSIIPFHPFLPPPPSFLLALQPRPGHQRCRSLSYSPFPMPVAGLAAPPRSHPLTTGWTASRPSPTRAGDASDRGQIRQIIPHLQPRRFLLIDQENVNGPSQSRRARRCRRRRSYPGVSVAASTNCIDCLQDVERPRNRTQYDAIVRKRQRSSGSEPAPVEDAIRGLRLRPAAQRLIERRLRP